ncbi:hypothetical protein Clacol_000223 [Clathrus columnatus]|uniref:P-loop containing nucleoside triphosphate hydrolase protein n=1 Tax=Clathrus columnatus TaxID=1419009 RepID=A0AAV5A0E0_9AGAM|nr:hypothetical protein Clacol_000223 [Clathrus columnatus]
MDNDESVKIKVITIAVGGATCSGKTTLAKHLRSCLHNSIIIHQDDFAPPQELIPIHPEYNVQDWDDAPGAIDWPRLAHFLHDIKQTGVIPESHKSHDHLNENKPVPIEDKLLNEWKSKSEEIVGTKPKEKIIWAILDGFLMYWHQDVIDQLDIRLFLRVPNDVLKQRRHERHGYHTAVQTDPEGSLWRDPPYYWEQIVYPAYVRAHQHLFTDGDVENGELNNRVPDLIMLDGTKQDMSQMLSRAMERVLEVSERL